MSGKLIGLVTLGFSIPALVTGIQMQASARAPAAPGSRSDSAAPEHASDRATKFRCLAIGIGGTIGSMRLLLDW